MLLAIRERIMGVVGWIIIGILFVAFSFFGLNSYLESSAENYAALVNDQEISLQRHQQAYQQLRRRMEDMLGENYNPALMDEDAIKANALQQLINESVVLQTAENDGYAASNQLVAVKLNGIDAFKEEGVFSQQQYKRILGYQGIGASQFENSLKNEIIIDQYRSGILATAAATQEGLDEAFLLEGQKRQFSYAVLPLTPYLENTEVTDADIEAYYAANGESFMTPEQIRIEYVELNASNIDIGMDVDEQTIQSLYDEQAAKYITPEDRDVRHILISLSPTATEATATAALESALSVVSRLEAGESFEALAGELSDDPGSSKNGGNLGFIGRGLMPAEFENAAYALKKGERSKPVKSPFGYHIVEVLAIKPEVAVPLDDVREELISQLQAEERDNQFYEQSESLSNLAFEQPDSLQGVADELDLQIITSDWIGKTGGSGVTGNTAVIEAAFSEDVLLNGNNSASIEIEPEHIVVVRVLEHRQASQKPLEEVKEAARDLVLNSKARERVSRQGAELLNNLKQQKTTLEATVAEDNLTLENTGLIARNATTPEREIVAAAFSIRPPVDAAVEFGGQQLRNGDYVVIALEQVKEGSLADLPDAARQQAWQALSKVFGDAELAAVMQSLREQANVQVPESTDVQ